MLAAFWSTHHGQSCTTTNTAAVACAFALRHHSKLLLAHTHARRSTLEACLRDEQALRERDAGDFANHGMDALFRLSRSGRLHEDRVADYAWSLLRDHRFDLLPGSSKALLPDAETVARIGEVFACARRAYDTILVDVHSGMDAAGSHALLAAADFRLVCLNQNLSLLDRALGEGEAFASLPDKPTLFLLSRYDREVSPSLRDIARRYGLPTGRFVAVPYSAGMMKACNAGRLYEFVLRHLDDRKSGERPLMDALCTLADRLAQAGDSVEKSAFPNGPAERAGGGVRP